MTNKEKNPLVINGFLPQSVQGMQGTGPENPVEFLMIIMYANESKRLIEIKKTLLFKKG